MQFLIDSAIKNGRSLAKKNFWFIILIMLTILLVQSIFYSLIFLIWGTTDTKSLGLIPNISINVLSMIIGIFIHIGRKNIAFQIASQGGAKYIDFWTRMPKLFFKFLLAFIFYFLVILLLFILPGILFFIGSKVIFLIILAAILGFVAFIFMIIFIIRIQFFPYIIIDKGFGSYKAMKQSREITRGHLWELIGFSMAKFILLMLGAILAFVGLLRAIPACQIATADVYKKLTGSSKSSDTTTTTKKPIAKKPLRKILRKAK